MRPDDSFEVAPAKAGDMASDPLLLRYRQQEAPFFEHPLREGRTARLPHIRPYLIRI